MRLTNCLAAALLVVSASAAVAARPSGEEKLARALEGKVAGEPVDCIFLHNIRSSQVFDRTAILYEAGGGRYYLNRPDSGASSLDDDDILVTNTHSSQLCSIDTVKLLDRSSHFYSGFVGLGKFVPYTKPKRAETR